MTASAEKTCLSVEPTSLNSISNEPELVSTILRPSEGRGIHSSSMTGPCTGRSDSSILAIKSPSRHAKSNAPRASATGVAKSLGIVSVTATSTSVFERSKLRDICCDSSSPSGSIVCAIPRSLLASIRSYRGRFVVARTPSEPARATAAVALATIAAWPGDEPTPDDATPEMVPAPKLTPVERAASLARDLSSSVGTAAAYGTVAAGKAKLQFRNN